MRISILSFALFYLLGCASAQKQKQAYSDLPAEVAALFRAPPAGPVRGVAYFHDGVCDYYEAVSNTVKVTRYDLRGASPSPRPGDYPSPEEQERFRKVLEASSGDSGAK